VKHAHTKLLFVPLFFQLIYPLLDIKSCDTMSAGVAELKTIPVLALIGFFKVTCPLSVRHQAMHDNFKSYADLYQKKVIAV